MSTSFRGGADQQQQKRDSFSTNGQHSNDNSRRQHGGGGQVQVQSPAYAQSPPNSLVAANFSPSPGPGGTKSPPRDRRGNQLSPIAGGASGGNGGGTGEPTSAVKRKAPGHTSTSLQGLAPKAAMGVPFIDNGKGAKRQVIGRAGDEEANNQMMMDEDPVEQYFHKKRDHRLPPLPDFSSPPPIMRTGFRPPDKAPILGQYQAHNYKEYRRMMKEAAQMKLGGLGANITADAEKATQKRRKMFQYGSSVNAVNFALMDVPEAEGLYSSKGPVGKPLPRKLTKEAELAEIKRQRALRYGEQFSAPVLRGRGTAKKAKTPQPDQHLLDELMRLEGKHNQDQQEILRIKAQLNL